MSFKAQFMADDLKLLLKDIGPAEKNYIDNILIYTLVKYMKELPGKCAKFIRGNIIENNPKWYRYELHIDGQNVASGPTFHNNPGEACRNALTLYTVDRNFCPSNPDRIDPW